MTRTQRLLNYLFQVIVGTTITFALSLAVVVSSQFQVDNNTLIVFSLLANLLFQLLFYNRYSFGITLGVFVVGGMILYLYLRSQDFQIPWYLQLRQVVEELYTFIYPTAPYDNRFDLLLGRGIPLFLGAFVSACLNWKYGFYPLIILGFSVFGVPALKRWASSPLGLILFSIAFLVLLYQRLHWLSATKGKGRQMTAPGVSFLILPMAVIVFGISWILPKPEVKTLSLPNHIRQGILTPQIDQKDIRFADKHGRLGGPNRQSDREVMRVKAKEHVYLAAFVYDTYEGDTWTLKDTSQGLFLDPLDNRLKVDQNLEAFSSPLWLDEQLDTKTLEVEITLTGGGSSRIFVPPFIQSMQVPLEEEYYYNYSGDIWSKKPLPKGTTYWVQYKAYNPTHPILQDSLRYNNLGGTDLRYYELPETIPQRVADLAAQITGEAYNNYDKLKAIEEYLAQFPYTLEPGNLPKDWDFVDHFLFEGKEGYCVYFASAMAVMARTQGIPARYVEGFVLPEAPNEDGTYRVTSRQAHAWVEAYFQGVGWVQFEPTPPFRGSLYNPSFVDEPESVESLVDEGLTPPSEPETDELLDPEGLENPVIRPEKQGGGGFVLAILLLVAFGGAYVYVSYKRYEKRRKREEGLDPQKGVEAYFQRLVGTAKALGHPMLGNETIQVYSQRVGQSLEFPEEGLSMDALGVIFNKAIYSKEEVTPEEKQQVEEAYNHLVAQLEGQSKLKIDFYIRKYVLHQF